MRIPNPTPHLSEHMFDALWSQLRASKKTYGLALPELEEEVRAQVVPALERQIHDVTSEVLFESTGGAYLPLNPTIIYVPSGEVPEALPGRYALADARDVITSHEPQIGPGLYPRTSVATRATPRQGPAALFYDPTWQERPYHSEEAEDHKVRDNARHFIPALAVNTDPTPVNGPPIVDRKLRVLGGNSRAMTMYLLYLQGQGDKIRAALRNACGSFCYGFLDSDLALFAWPMLIRVLELDADEQPEEGRRLTRALNVSFTQELNLAAEVTSRARAIDAQCAKDDKSCVSPWIEIGRSIDRSKKADESLNDFLLSERSRSLVRYMLEIGVISPRNINRLTIRKGKKQGLLSKDGRDFLTRLMLGYVVDDAHIVDVLKEREMQTLEDIAPYVTMATCCDPVYDITDDLRLALRALQATPAGTKTLHRAVGQVGLFAAVETDDSRQHVFDLLYKVPRAVTLYQALLHLKNSPAQARAAFQAYAEETAKSDDRAMDLFGGPSPDEKEALALKKLKESFLFVSDPSVPYTGVQIANVVAKDAESSLQAVFGKKNVKVEIDVAENPRKFYNGTVVVTPKGKQKFNKFHFTFYDGPGARERVDKAIAGYQQGSDVRSRIESDLATVFGKKGVRVDLDITPSGPTPYKIQAFVEPNKGQSFQRFHFAANTPEDAQEEAQAAILAYRTGEQP